MKIIFSFIILLFSFSLFPIELTLAENISIDKEKCYLHDLIAENEKNNVKNIFIAGWNADNHIIISADEILKLLFKSNIYNVSINGERAEIFFENNNTKEKIILNTPLTALENHFKKYLPAKYFSASVALKNINPKIDLNSNFLPIIWEYPKVGDIFSDYKKIKKINFSVNNVKYESEIELTIKCTVWSAKESFQRESLLDKNSFEPKIIDYSALSSPDSVVFDIDKYKNYRSAKSIQVGEILRNTSIKKNILVLKNEAVKVHYLKNSFEIVITGSALHDGYENEKIKIKLSNNKELSGVLKISNGEKYVEI